MNIYGDRKITTMAGKGIDVSSQRADELDMMAVGYIRSIQPGPVFAVDVGCGHGGQAARMASAGARVVAMDAQDYRIELAENLAREGVHPSTCSYICADVESEPFIGPFNVVMCQRMIHYFEYGAAMKAIAWFKRIALSGGKLFLSASGLDSELGNGYPAQDISIERRFAHLSPKMAQKHSILAPVCLYRPDELSMLVCNAGWFVENVFVSPFGNVKLVAVKV